MRNPRSPSPTHVETAAPTVRPGRSPAARYLRSQLFSTLALFVLSLSTTPLAASDCISIQEASHHVGEVKCVTGKVLRVKAGSKGVHHVDFCEQQMACPFSVVVFPSDLKDVGDVRRLAGHLIEIHGAVKLYGGRAEIILSRVGQLTGGSTLIPPLPKNYDVEQRGHYSPGRMRPSKRPRKIKPRPSDTATYGRETQTDAEGSDPPD